LALDLSARGFGYAVVDARRGLLDFGCSSFVASDDDKFVERVSALIVRHNPRALVVENFAATQAKTTATRRCKLAIQLAQLHQLGMVQVSRTIVQRVLGGTTKATRAKLIASMYPELERLLPRPRALWQAEAKRMSIFDALALALVVLRPKQAEDR
jgi:hypothetical protein